MRAQGWLLKQLEMQRDGLTGHAEEVLTELNQTSAWRGGDKDNWERSPYYVKGLIPLAYTLDDPALKSRAQKWIDWCLSSQRPDGSYGPTQNNDWWPRMVSDYFLRDYYDATSDRRVLPFLTKYYHYMLQTLPTRPLRDWGKSRAGDDMDTALWLYNRTGDPALLDLVDLLRKQAYDWPTILRENTFQSFGSDFQPKHNVNIPQAMKMPAVSWERTGDQNERTSIDIGQANLLRENGLSVGMESGTEFLAGRSPGQGIEFCSIVEQMLSDETIVRIFGDAKYSDQLEEIAYNALPAAWNRDLTALRYYTVPNLVLSKRGPQGFGQNYDNGVVYGPRSGYPCCCFNAHQGWPKFVQNSWAATPDNGLAVIAYAPNIVTAQVAHDATATITQETQYPFADEIRFKITVSKPSTFPLALRTPGWCDEPILTVNGKSVAAAKTGEFAKITRQWKTGDQVLLKLPMHVRLIHGVHDSVSVHRGPLEYALQIGADKHVVEQLKPGFNEFEETPTASWNYALSVNSKNAGNSFELLTDIAKPANANPFTPETTPVKLIATARKLPEWGLAWNGLVAADPPASPVQSAAPPQQITLIPFGSEDLRIADFPILANSPPAAKNKSLHFTFAKNTTTGWTWFGGGWYARDGKLHTSPNGGAPGFKALLDNHTYSNLRFEADITPPPTGDAGLIFRVTNPSIGPDAYQGYYAGISASAHNVVLGRADGKTWTPLKVVPHPIPAGQPTRLTVTAQDNQITLRLNDDPTPILSLSDDHYPSGQVGVRMYTTDKGQATSSFGNIHITPLDPSN
ncbi:MAG TPA: beta-L-arabinofuranosidase domain-containing protein [Tepidisphaeraceae bacterium]|nr:beta-L-arabinofuranosidase domain-containing protein [Tepidisphaeraceae bacterium]